MWTIIIVALVLLLALAILYFCCRGTKADQADTKEIRQPLLVQPEDKPCDEPVVDKVTPGVSD